MQSVFKKKHVYSLGDEHLFSVINSKCNRAQFEGYEMDLRIPSTLADADSYLTELLYMHKR
jgi:hypothetical protein